jgi:hypothetical protein
VISSNASPAERLVFGVDDRGILKDGVKTYRMAPVSPLNSPIFSSCLHIYSPCFGPRHQGQKLDRILTTHRQISAECNDMDLSDLSCCLPSHFEPRGEFPCIESPLMVRLREKHKLGTGRRVESHEKITRAAHSPPQSTSDTIKGTRHFVIKKSSAVQPNSQDLQHQTRHNGS